MLVREFIRDCCCYFDRELSFSIGNLAYSFVSLKPLDASYMSDVVAFEISQSDKAVDIMNFVDALSRIPDKNKKIVFLSGNSYFEFEDKYEVKDYTHFIVSLKQIASAGGRVNNSKEPDILTSADLKGYTCYCADEFHFDSEYAEYWVNINGV